MSGQVDVSPSTYKDLPIDVDYIPDELSIQAKNELFEDEKTRIERLMKLRAMLEREVGLCWQDDDLFLLAFLRARKFDVNRAVNLIKGLYNSFGKRDRIYYRLTFNCLRRIMAENSMYFLPHRDDKGSVVFYFRYCAWDPSVSTAEELLVCMSFGLMQALCSPVTQITGFQFIMDFKGFNIRHFLNSTPPVLVFIAEILQNSVPVRVRKIHIVNESSGFYPLWRIIKPFLSKKLQERVNIHGKDLKRLHKFVPPSILPADLGGELPPFDNTDWRERMENSADYIRHVRCFGYEKFLYNDNGQEKKSIFGILSSS